ncbi:myb/SANT-like DNA-binding domain-containing protein 1 [Ixodes scapularis]
MAAPEAAAKSQRSKSAQPGKKRINWPVAITEALIRIWEDNLQALRSNTRNAAIYAAMAEQLNAGAGLRSGEEPYTAKQIRQKLENLNKQYRKLKQSGTTTGSKGVEWPFYWQLHNFLGSLPINNEFLAEENVEVPLVDEIADDAEVVVSWDQDDDNDDMPHEDCTMPGSGNEAALAHSPGSQSVSLTDGASPSSSYLTTSGSSGCSGTSTSFATRKNKSRKRPAASLMQQLLTMQSEETERAAKMEKKRLKRQKELPWLIKESNDMQASMLRMMEAYFESKKNKK